MPIQEHIETRTKCPLCLSTNISQGIEPHVNLQFPILPVCVDQPRENDDVAPFTICICEDCGLILLKDIVDPEILYKIFHSDGIGKVWDAHYTAFADLIKKHLSQEKFYVSVHIFHGVEQIIFLLLLGWWLGPLFIWIALGVTFHLFLDTISETTPFGRFWRISFLFVLIALRNQEHVEKAKHRS